MADNEKNLDRREFLRKAAITGAVAWAVPVIQSVAASPAYAQTTPTTCVHSPVGAGNPSCKGACATRANQVCGAGKDCGGGCETVCAACIGGGGNPCPSPDYCNPACFNIVSCSGSCTVTFGC